MTLPEILHPPFEIYDRVNISDAEGHLLSAEDPEIAEAILQVLNAAWESSL